MENALSAILVILGFNGQKEYGHVNKLYICIFISGF